MRNSNSKTKNDGSSDNQKDGSSDNCTRIESKFLETKLNSRITTVLKSSHNNNNNK